MDHFQLMKTKILNHFNPVGIVVILLFKSILTLITPLRLGHVSGLFPRSSQKTCMYLLSSLQEKTNELTGFAASNMNGIFLGDGFVLD
jgi:hypothetical protein